MTPSSSCTEDCWFCIFLEPLPCAPSSGNRTCAGCKNGHVFPAGQSHPSTHLPAVVGPVGILPWASLSLLEPLSCHMEKACQESGRMRPPGKRNRVKWRDGWNPGGVNLTVAAPEALVPRFLPSLPSAVPVSSLLVRAELGFCHLQPKRGRAPASRTLPPCQPSNQ